MPPTTIKEDTNMTTAMGTASNPAQELTSLREMVDKAKNLKTKYETTLQNRREEKARLLAELPAGVNEDNLDATIAELDAAVQKGIQDVKAMLPLDLIAREQV